MQSTEDKNLQLEISKHYIQPENYGHLYGANCVGVGRENSSQSYVIMQMKLNKTHILDVKFSSNATQDVNTLGSIFTEMIKGDEIAMALNTADMLEQELETSYANVPKPSVDLSKPQGEQVTYISTEFQDSANMVLTSFRAAIRHFERQEEGIEEESFEMNIEKSCPYSGTDCHFMQKDSTKQAGI